MKNFWPAKIMFPKEGTGFLLIGQDSSHLNNFHVSETLGMLASLSMSTFILGSSDLYSLTKLICYAGLNLRY